MIKDIITQLRPLMVIFAAYSSLPDRVSGRRIRVGQMAFPSQADGSLIYNDGQAVGSTLIGQQFSDPNTSDRRPVVYGHVSV